MSRAAILREEHSEFFNMAARSAHRVLMLDYDGTLAPFVRDRHRAAPYPDIPELLRQIMHSCDTRLIIVSGRTAAEVPPLLGLYPIPEIWGAHGVERILPNGRRQELSVDEDALQTLLRAETELDAAELGPHIEVKLAGIALHWRGLSPAKILEIRTKGYRILKPLARRSELTLAEFEEGVELRLSLANKGKAMEDLLSQLDAGAAIAYLGDDSTDEDAFRALNGRGLSVLVRPQYRFTAAKMWLKPPDDVIRFLMNWIDACGLGQ